MGYFEHLCRNWLVAGRCVNLFLEHFLHGLIPFISWEHGHKNKEEVSK